MKFTQSLKSSVFPFFKKVRSRIEKTKLQDLQNTIATYKTWVPPGHFYSPIPAKSEIAKYDSVDFYSEEDFALQGINFQPAKQKKVFMGMLPFLQKLPYTSQKSKKNRYYFENANFEYFDGSVLTAMLQYLKPQRVIEIGSGYSTCAIFDVKDTQKFTFTSIEPYPELVYSLLKKKDIATSTFIAKPVQEVPLSVFEELESGDVLFIDSTHVSKFNSDVNTEIFKILPRLKKGVYVHFHDMFYPMEYPKKWLEMGIAWNEMYLLHAFLSFNSEFEIVFMNNYFTSHFPALMQEKFPLGLKNPGGSMWIRRKG